MRADEQNEAVVIAPGKAGLTGFNEDFEGRVVLDPFALGFVEISVNGIHKISDYAPRLPRFGRQAGRLMIGWWMAIFLKFNFGADNRG